MGSPFEEGKSNSGKMPESDAKDQSVLNGDPDKVDKQVHKSAVVSEIPSSHAPVISDLRNEFSTPEKSHPEQDTRAAQNTGNESGQIGTEGPQLYQEMASPHEASQLCSHSRSSIKMSDTSCDGPVKMSNLLPFTDEDTAVFPSPGTFTESVPSPKYKTKVSLGTKSSIIMDKSADGNSSTQFEEPGATMKNGKQILVQEHPSQGSPLSMPSVMKNDTKVRGQYREASRGGADRRKEQTKTKAEGVVHEVPASNADLASQDSEEVTGCGRDNHRLFLQASVSDTDHPKHGHEDQSSVASGSNKSKSLSVDTVINIDIYKEGIEDVKLNAIAFQTLILPLPPQVYIGQERRVRGRPHLPKAFSPCTHGLWNGQGVPEVCVRCRREM